MINFYLLMILLIIAPQESSAGDKKFKKRPKEGMSIEFGTAPVEKIIIHSVVIDKANATILTYSRDGLISEEVPLPDALADRLIERFPFRDNERDAKTARSILSCGQPAIVRFRADQNDIKFCLDRLSGASKKKFRQWVEGVQALMGMPSD